jgi:hypothetical protein
VKVTEAHRLDAKAAPDAGKQEKVVEFRRGGAEIYRED